jgi:hypothetical protein
MDFTAVGKSISCFPGWTGRMYNQCKLNSLPGLL